MYKSIWVAAFYFSNFKRIKTRFPSVWAHWCSATILDFELFLLLTDTFQLFFKNSFFKFEVQFCFQFCFVAMTLSAFPFQRMLCTYPKSAAWISFVLFLESLTHQTQFISSKLYISLQIWCCSKVADWRKVRPLRMSRSPSKSQPSFLLPDSLSHKDWSSCEFYRFWLSLYQFWRYSIVWKYQLSPQLE